MIRKIALVLTTVSFMACGASKNDSIKATENQPEAESAEVETPPLPSFIVVKVPVDASGNELTSKAESKTFDQNEFSAAESTGVAFEKGKSVSLANELDTDTSSGQWYYGYGYSRRQARRAYRYGYGYGNPYYSYYGNYYNYGYYNTYNYNSCNYYVYSSPYYY